MPAVLDSCVESLLKKWKADPKSRPTPRKKGKDGKPQDARSQAFAICTSSLKAAGKLEADLVELEFKNPVITGIGATNRPHIQGLDPMSFIQEGEKKLLKIPLLILGKWKHKNGILEFTQGFVEKVTKAFHDGVAGYDLAVDIRHKPLLGALAWVKRFVQEVRPDGKTQFSAIGETTDSGNKVIENKRYRYASIEFYRDFQNRLVEALSTDDIIEEFTADSCDINWDEILDLEDNMSDTEQAVTLEELQAELAQARQEAKEHEDSLRAELETERARTSTLEVFAAKQFVDRIVLQAESYRDNDERAHSKVFLEWLGKVLLCESIGEEGDQAITLESPDAPKGLHEYYRRSIAWLAGNMPGVVPMGQTKTERDKKRVVSDSQDPDALELDEDDVQEIKDGWGFVPTSSQED